ncbi:MAG: hypothetical protein WCD18_02370, partial [Thermosynechococcaceae cyanobacterium]
LEGHSSSVRSVSWSPDGKTLATGSDDKTVKLWNFNLDELLGQGCHWLADYLNNNPKGQRNQALCHGILPPSRQSSRPSHPTFSLAVLWQRLQNAIALPKS